MTDRREPRPDWNKTFPRIGVALALILLGLAGFYGFGLSNGAAEKSQQAAFEVEMDKAEAKSDAAQAAKDAERAEAWN